MEYVVQTHQLCRRFGDLLAVDHLDLRVEAGTFYGFLGTNGAGKSTTIKMLTGLLTPTAGSVRVLGYNMLDAKESLQAKKSIGVIPESLALFDNLTALDYLTFVGRIHGLERSVVRKRSLELMDLLNLDHTSQTITLEFSHGMRKKLSLAAALLPNPKLLFLDEPFEGVDAVASKTIRDLLHQFIAKGGTVFLTSHILEIVQRLCTHVGIITRGSLVLSEKLETLTGQGSLETAFMKAVGGGAVEISGKLDWLTRD
jgi:ABC-2 type transport system ATP-binding protein